MQYEEIKQEIIEFYGEEDSYADSYGDDSPLRKFATATIGALHKAGVFHEVYRDSGNSETHTAWYSVKLFKDHDVYIKVDGYADSYATDYISFYEGWQSLSEVRPKEVTEIRYVPLSDL